MIRRDAPRTDDPTHWLLIPQQEHARLSYELAAEWRDLLPDAPDRVREELLTAMLRHDDGWPEWDAQPLIDPEHGRPYGFTEMPPAEAQRLWSASIDICRAIGPLAGWVAASHFIHLQDKQDDDFHEWRPWLAQQDAHREAWLRDWSSQDARHTPHLAERCLALLQTFDWLSLWLCCLAPLNPADPREELTLGAEDKAFGVFGFRSAADGKIGVRPWPFKTNSLALRAPARLAPVGPYASQEQLLAATAPAELGWSLAKA